MSSEFSVNPSQCQADKHVLVVVHGRRWLVVGKELSYLRCCCCDLRLGPLATNSSNGPSLSRGKSGNG
jgi:hypothetical protein